MSGLYREERKLFYAPRSAPVGRRDLRPHRKVRFGQRMKPRSWADRLWFKSALFARGLQSCRRAFANLMNRGRP